MKSSVAAVLFLVAFGCQVSWGQTPGDCKPSSLNIPEAKYPCVYPDNRATFRVVAPDAQKSNVLSIAGGQHDSSQQDGAARDGDVVHRRAGVECRLRPGQDHGAGRRAGGAAGHRRAHHDSRQGTRRQPGRGRRRPHRPRLSAAQLLQRTEPSLSGRVRASRLFDRRRAMVAGDPRAADHRRRVRSSVRKR